MNTELIARLIAAANKEANELADLLNEAADALEAAQPLRAVVKLTASPPDYWETKEALKWLDQMVICAGAENGPSIKLRAAIMAMNAAWNAAGFSAYARISELRTKLEAAQQLGSPGKVGSNDLRTDYLSTQETPFNIAAQPAGEPVAWMHVDGFAELAAGKSQIIYPKPANMGYAPLHRHPAPQVPMTEDEVEKAIGESVGHGDGFLFCRFVRAIEAHHNIGVKP